MITVQEIKNRASTDLIEKYDGKDWMSNVPDVVNAGRGKADVSDVTTLSAMVNSSVLAPTLNPAPIRESTITVRDNNAMTLKRHWRK